MRGVELALRVQAEEEPVSLGIDEQDQLAFA
jgi:hypothetical protein